jgi:hypothetical protein
MCVSYLKLFLLFFIFCVYPYSFSRRTAGLINVPKQDGKDRSYFNSVMQVMAQCEDFNSAVKDRIIQGDAPSLTEEQGFFLREYNSLISNMCSDEGACDGVNFYDLVAGLFFEGSHKAQDPAILFSRLLNFMVKNCGVVSSERPFFHFNFTRAGICRNRACPAFGNAVQMGLSPAPSIDNSVAVLGVPALGPIRTDCVEIPYPDIENCIDRVCQMDTSQDDLRCLSCKSEEILETRKLIYNVGRYLVISLNRFDSEGNKINKEPVAARAILNVAPFMFNPLSSDGRKHRPVVYNLIAIIVHNGKKSLKNDKFVTYVRNFQRKSWICYKNDEISETESLDLLRENYYTHTCVAVYEDFSRSIAITPPSCVQGSFEEDADQLEENSRNRFVPISEEEMQHRRRAQFVEDTGIDIEIPAVFEGERERAVPVKITKKDSVTQTKESSFWNRSYLGSGRYPLRSLSKKAWGK